MVEVGLRVWDEGFGEVRRKVLSICPLFGFPRSGSRGFFAQGFVI
jgi:hypothetical protein